MSCKTPLAVRELLYFSFGNTEDNKFFETSIGELNNWLDQRFDVRFKSHFVSPSDQGEHCIQKDPAVPRRFIIRRAQLQDDEQLVREYAENPEIKEGLWRMHKAGLVNCTCEAIAIHFLEFADLRDIVKEKVPQLNSAGT